jgi:hypothetical protein
VPSAPLWLLALGVLPGYALMLDTFAALPLQIYAWGFSPLALLCLLAVSLLPGLRRRLPLAWGVPEVWVAPAAPGCVSRRFNRQSSPATTRG